MQLFGLFEISAELRRTKRIHMGFEGKQYQCWAIGASGKNIKVNTHVFLMTFILQSCVSILCEQAYVMVIRIL